MVMQSNTSKARDILTRTLHLVDCPAVVFILGLMLSGCSSDRYSDSKASNDSPESKLEANSSAKPADAAPMQKMAMSNPSEIVFKDEVVSNIEVPPGLDELIFLDTTGKRITLGSYLGNKNVVLVFTEGFGGGMLCPFFKTQTSRLVANYDKFTHLDTEVVVVYPGARDHLDEFIEAATNNEKAEIDRIPFPLVLDENLSAVGHFNIASNLAHPSTFIIDKQGNVRLAYVGADMTADRPSIAAMLDILKSTNSQ